MFTIKNMIEVIVLSKKLFYLFKINNINKKIQKCEIDLKEMKLKISLNLFYADKIYHESNKPFTYFTKVKIKSNSKQFDKLINKRFKMWTELKVLYSNLELFENNK